MKKLVHLTTVHHPKDSRIFYRECCSLSQQQYQVVLMASGNHDFYENNVQIKSLGQTKNRLHRMTLFQLKTFILALRQKAHCYHFHDPELIITGFLLKLCGKKVIYDVHEDVPRDIKLKTHIPFLFKQPLASIVSLLEKCAGHLFDGIVTVTPTIASRFPKHKVTLVRNYPTESFAPFSFENYVKRDLDLIYIGSINESRGLKEMIEVSQQLQKSLTLIGHLSKALNEQYIQKSKHELIKYIQWLTSPELKDYLLKSKVGLVILHPTPTFITSYPLKMFEYMAAGLPIIASNFPEWTEIINHYKCGIAVDPTDKNDIAQAIQYLLDNPEKAYQMGQNGRLAIQKELNWDTEAQKLVETYENIL